MITICTRIFTPLIIACALLTTASAEEFSAKDVLISLDISEKDIKKLEDGEVVTFSGEDYEQSKRELASDATVLINKSLDTVLERLNKPVDEAILIDVDTEQVIRRIAKRATEEGRSDDTEETVRNRMRIYAEQTAPVADYYAERGLLTKVLGDGCKEEVLERILSVLNISASSACTTG